MQDSEQQKTITQLTFAIVQYEGVLQKMNHEFQSLLTKHKLSEEQLASKEILLQTQTSKLLDAQENAYQLQQKGESKLHTPHKKHSKRKHGIQGPPGTNSTRYPHQKVSFANPTQNVN